MRNTPLRKGVHQAIVQVGGDRLAALAGGEDRRLHGGASEGSGKPLLIDRLTVTGISLKQEVSIVTLIERVVVKKPVTAQPDQMGPERLQLLFENAEPSIVGHFKHDMTAPEERTERFEHTRLLILDLQLITLIEVVGQRGKKQNAQRPRFELRHFYLNRRTGAGKRELPVQCEKSVIMLPYRLPRELQYRRIVTFDDHGKNGLPRLLLCLPQLFVGTQGVPEPCADLLQEFIGNQSILVCIQ